MDGVDYRHGNREDFFHLEAVTCLGDPVLAGELLRALFADPPAEIRRLRAGWASLRWLVEEEGAPLWTGPGYLFSFDTPEGERKFEVEYTGEDSSEWAPLGS